MNLGSNYVTAESIWYSLLSLCLLDLEQTLKHIQILI